jgi:hypothetical protein
MTNFHGPADVSTFRLRRRTPGSFLLVPCPKQGRSIRCQGQLEAAAAVILVACPRVVHIQEQPLAIWYAWQDVGGQADIQLLDGPPASCPKRRNGRRPTYIVPDFLVEMTGGHKRLVEVKPSERLLRPKVQRKLAVARQFAARTGWTFHVVTEKELFRGDLLSNVRLLNRYRQARVDGDVLDRLEGGMPEGGIELGALLSSAKPEHASDLRVHVFHLLATGRLGFDPRAGSFNDQTVLFPGGAISWDPFDSVWAPSGCSTGGSGGSSANPPPTASLPKTSSST